VTSRSATSPPDGPRTRSSSPASPPTISGLSSPSFLSTRAYFSDRRRHTWLFAGVVSMNPESPARCRAPRFNTRADLIEFLSDPRDQLALPGLRRGLKICRDLRQGRCRPAGPLSQGDERASSTPHNMLAGLGTMTRSSRSGIRVLGYDDRHPPGELRSRHPAARAGVPAGTTTRPPS